MHDPAVPADVLSMTRTREDGFTLIELLAVILIIGILVDQLFGLVDRAIRTRWGLDRVGD